MSARVCAQALYAAQAASTRDPALREGFEEAAKEETDHLAWTATRLEQLHSRPSLLNPLWYAGAFALGFVAGKAGDAVSLGFVVETERQVEEHLAGHLDRLPEGDLASRAIVEAMRQDEVAHGARGRGGGGGRAPESGNRRHARRRQGDDGDGLLDLSRDHASTTSNEWVNVAVLASMTDAEQSLSCERAMAR